MTDEELIQTALITDLIAATDRYRRRMSELRGCGAYQVDITDMIATTLMRAAALENALLMLDLAPAIPAAQLPDRVAELLDALARDVVDQSVKGARSVKLMLRVFPEDVPARGSDGRADR
jgi:hypothetical protein